MRLGNQLFLFFRSIRYLKRSQALYFARFRILGQKRVAEHNLPGRFKSSLSCRLLSLDRAIISPCGSKIRFLNHSEPFLSTNVNWQPRGVSRLWRYNLHYFDYLRQRDVPDQRKDAIIQTWIAQNPQMSRTAWEPYTTSLRCVNWIGYFVGKEVSPTWTDNLFLQARWLYANLERHILANHYFENIKSLLFSAYYFSGLTGSVGKEAAEWKAFALAELESELHEQFLPDGGHYERSPQYHLLMMQNCIEILILLRGTPEGPLKTCRILQSIIQRGLALAASIARPDGEIPLFNDSALDQTPSLKKLIAEATDLGIAILPPGARWTLIAAENSGIYGIRNASNWLMIDCGDIGPAYQPGHTHCDFLSYELMLDQHMVVVDTGVFEYEPGKLRRLARSTQAHNTVSVEGREQSQIWGAFRVGARAQKNFATIHRHEDEVTFCGSYVGFHAGRHNAKHTRTVHLQLETEGFGFKSIRISDEVTASCSRSVTIKSFVHLHPDVELISLNASEHTLSREGKEVARLVVEDADTTVVEDSIYCPQFGMKYDSKKLVMKSKRKCITYRLQIC